MYRGLYYSNARIANAQECHMYSQLQKTTRLLLVINLISSNQGWYSNAQKDTHIFTFGIFCLEIFCHII